MQEIQSACAELARHRDQYVSSHSLQIMRYDHDREIQYDNDLVEKDALLSTAKAELKVVKADNRRLRAQLSKSQDMQFGQSSERSGRKKKNDSEGEGGPTAPDPNGDQPNSGRVPATEAESKPKPRGMLGKQAVEIPPHIPRDPKVIRPEHGAKCSCGCTMRQFGEQTIERLTFKPAEVRAIQERYPQYVCDDCDRVVQAPVPKRAFDQTRFDDHFIAAIAVEKFADFLPYYRQEQRLKRSGVKISRATMGRLMDKAVEAILPLHGVLEADLKSSSVLGMDETTLAQLNPGSGKTKTCYVWALCRDDRRWLGNSRPGVVFHFKQSRHGKHAEEILDGYNGVLQVDGFPGYNRLTRQERLGGPLELSYCWAHARRKFLDVHKATKSGWALKIYDLINVIYDVEGEMRAQPASVRLAERKLKSAPLVAKLHRMLLKLSSEISMKSTLGGAINYTLKLWNGLIIFLSDGRVEMDNNAVENTIRPIALLRKNALFAGSEIGGRNWAVMASIMGTCRMNGVEPYAYLTWVFEQMAKGHPRSRYDELLPWNCPSGCFGIE